MQANYTGTEKTIIKNIFDIMDIHNDLSVKLIEENPDLIVWPETAILEKLTVLHSEQKAFRMTKELQKLHFYKINGQTTTKYKIEFTRKSKETFFGYAWLTQQNIPIRFKGTATDEGTRQDVEINYTNIVIAKQDPRLFTIPGDYRELPTGMGGMGGGAQGMTPEQMKQLKERMKNRNQP